MRQAGSLRRERSSLKAADYHLAFRSCTQSDHRCIGSFGRKPKASLSQTSADSRQISEQSERALTIYGPRQKTESQIAIIERPERMVAVRRKLIKKALFRGADNIEAV